MYFSFTLLNLNYVLFRFDCGMFVLKNADCLGQDLDPAAGHYAQKDMPNVRRVALLELIRLKLSGTATATLPAVEDAAEAKGATTMVTDATTARPVEARVEDAADTTEATATVGDATTVTCRVEARVEDAAAAKEATAMVEDAIILTARVAAVSKAEEATAVVEDAIPARVIEARVEDAAEAKEATVMVEDATTARVDAKLGKDQLKSESESELNQRRSEFETDIHPSTIEYGAPSSEPSSKRPKPKEVESDSDPDDDQPLSKRLKDNDANKHEDEEATEDEGVKPEDEDDDNEDDNKDDDEDAGEADTVWDMENEDEKLTA